MQVLIAVMGILVTLLVSVGMVLITPHNVEQVIRDDAGVVAPTDDEDGD